VQKYLRDQITYHHRDPADFGAPACHRTGWGEAVQCEPGPVPWVIQGRGSYPTDACGHGYLVTRPNGHRLFLDAALLSDHPICEGCGEPSPEGLTSALYAPTDSRQSRLCPRCLADRP
jgi:hypothetical protein